MGELIKPNFGAANEKNDSADNKERIKKLNEKDNHYEYSEYDLAKAEDGIRKYLVSKGIPGNSLDEVADRFSDVTLEKLEANKEREIDPLTGLRNKKAYEEQLPQLLSMEQRSGKNCSLLMIDFDHFKQVNDSFGHPAGDMALKKMAAIIRDQVRSSDIVYRFGGEEFVVFLPDTVSETAQELAERIRSAVKNHEIGIVDEKGEEISLNKTVSIGVVGTDQLAEWDGYSERDAKDFLDKMTKFSDLAMYASKTGGRNKVTLYGENLKKIAA
jgi:diguanylate cyclase (GGDEF)-like protein